MINKMTPNQILQGDVLEVAKSLPSQWVNCIVTSPPYFGLRDYQTAEWEGGEPACDHQPGSQTRAAGSTLDGGHNHGGHLLEGYKSSCPKCGAIRIDKQIGLEDTPEVYVSKLVTIFRELRRVLRDDGTLWLVIGDSYSGSWGNYGDAGGGQRDKKTERFDRPAYVDKTQWRPPTSFSHPSIKPKDLIGIPWMVAFALRSDGWYLRSDIIWSKTNCMPESVIDRPTKSHEHIFLLAKSAKYFYDQDAIREPHKEESLKRDEAGYKADFVGRHTMPGEPRPHSDDHNGFVHPQGRNKRSVWTIPTKSYKEAHFATFPTSLIEPCILAGCPAQVCIECGAPFKQKIEATGHINRREPAYVPNNTPTKIDSSGWGPMTRSTNKFEATCNCNVSTRPGIVLDPFFGAGTVGVVCEQTKRHWLGIELNPEYIKLAKARILKTQPALFPI